MSLLTQVETGELGSPASEQLLHTLRPSYWFAAHLHTKFGAVVGVGAVCAC
jgi:lariat debranching enzyme